MGIVQLFVRSNEEKIWAEDEVEETPENQAIYQNWLWKATINSNIIKAYIFKLEFDQDATRKIHSKNPDWNGINRILIKLKRISRAETKGSGRNYVRNRVESSLSLRFELKWEQLRPEKPRVPGSWSKSRRCQGFSVNPLAVPSTQDQHPRTHHLFTACSGDSPYERSELSQRIKEPDATVAGGEAWRRFRPIADECGIFER